MHLPPRCDQLGIEHSISYLNTSHGMCSVLAPYLDVGRHVTYFDHPTSLLYFHYFPVLAIWYSHTSAKGQSDNFLD